MILRQRLTFINRSDFAFSTTTANWPAQQLKVPIDRTWPLEEILIIMTATAKAAITTQKGYGILNLLKKINLSVNDGTQPRSVVDVTGPGVFGYAMQVGLNTDRGSLGTLQASSNLQTSQANGLVNTGIYRIVYRIPIVHPSLTDDLRPRALLPIHLFPQDPILTLDFASATELSGTADPFSAVQCEVVLVRRDMPQSVNDAILATGGYFKFDLNESITTLATGITNTEQRLDIPLPGQYSGIYMHMLNGTPAPQDISALAGPSANIGTETRWRIESGGIFFREWRQKYLQIINDQSRPAWAPYSMNPLGGLINGISASGLTSGAPPVLVTAQVAIMANNLGGVIAPGLCVQDPSSVYLDFMGDGITDISELGSLLDCNLPSNQGLKMQIIGNVTTTGANASTIGLVGHRFFGDLSKYQSLSMAK